MNSLTVLTVLSLSAITWAATVPASLVQKNNDPKIVWNIILPEDVASGDAGISIRSSRQIDVSDISTKEGVESDVYWRPWRHGQIPQDALVGAFGETECGTDVPIYIAQVFHQGSESAIIPAQLFKKTKKVTVSYGRNQYRYKDNVKILCADDPSIVTWVPIKDTEALNIIANEDCIVAGAELSFNTFLGRTNHDDETIIGKVLYHSKTMFFPYEDEEINIRENFDILCYKNAVENKRIAALRKQQESKLEQAESKVSTEN